MTLRDPLAKLRFRTTLSRGFGWAAFALGWVGVFLPGLPTTIFWILAALAFLRTNPRMYAKIVGHKRFGPAIRLYVEEGRISARGKAISISAMLLFAGLGALAMSSAWIRILALGLAAIGSLRVALIPLAERKAGLSVQGNPPSLGTGIPVELTKD